jgi:23S rRNA (adenine2503-C2)-methyltransferase
MKPDGVRDAAARIPVTELDALEGWAKTCGVGAYPLKRFRVAFFKKGLPFAACLEALPEGLRGVFASGLAAEPLTLVARRDSGVDGASKLAFRTADGLLLEAVLLRVASGRTSLCISSQVGCAANCAFCATGKMGLLRNLTAAEMLDQVVQAQRLAGAEGRTLRNVVFMGMGEPLHNERGVYGALEVLRDPRAFYLADRHLMVSTVGMVEAMGRFRARYPTVRLALSLHSARAEVRRELMPAGKSQTLARLREVLPPAGSPHPLMIEVTLLRGVNDGPEDCRALMEYLRGSAVHINLIPFNPHPGSAFAPTPRAEREAFAAALRAAGFTVTVRRSLGDDIAAACGQLAGVVEGTMQGG